MANTYKVLYQGQPTGSATAVITVGASKQQVISSILISNPTTTAKDITLWVNGSADANMIQPATSVAAKGVLLLEYPITLNTTETLYAMSSTTTTLTVTVFGVEVS